MTRVSENSNKSSLNFALNKAKQKLEDLQLKGSTFKKIIKPSDNPVNNVQALEIGSRLKDNSQYLKNSDYAMLNLNIVERSLEELTDIIVKAK